MTRENSYSHVFRLEAPRSRVFQLLSDPTYLDLLTPTWFRLQLLGEPPRELGIGTELSYRLRWRGLPFRWTSLLTEWRSSVYFTYEQKRGPYRTFRHEHLFRSVGLATEVTDRVFFRTPGGPYADKLISKPDLRRIFAYREKRAASVLSLLEKAPKGAPSRTLTSEPSMRASG